MIPEVSKFSDHYFLVIFQSNTTSGGKSRYISNRQLFLAIAESRKIQKNFIFEEINSKSLLNLGNVRISGWRNGDISIVDS